MAGPRIRPLHLSSQPELVQAAAASPDGDAFRIVHHPSPQAEVSGWVWAEPHNGSRSVRVGLWALGCGHCGATHCAHVDATLQHLNQVLSAAPTPDTWQAAAAGAPAQLAERARRAADRHHRRVAERQAREALSETERGDRFDAAVRQARAGTAADSLPFLRENAVGGHASRSRGRPMAVNVLVDMRIPAVSTPDGEEDEEQVFGELRRRLAAVGDSGRVRSDWWRITESSGRGWVTLDGVYDERAVWDDMAEACELLQEAGAGDSGAHRAMTVSVGFDHGFEVGELNGLLRAARRYDDVLARVGGGPSGRPRRNWGWEQDHTAVDAYATLAEVRNDYAPGGERPLTFQLLSGPDQPAAVMELVSGEATVDPGRLQGYVNVAAAVFSAGEDPTADWGDPVPRGTHREGGGADGDEMAREFAERMFTRAEQVDQFAALYAGAEWRPPRSGPPR